MKENASTLANPSCSRKPLSIGVSDTDGKVGSDSALVVRSRRLFPGSHLQTSLV